jgi:YebC/PmpR family DNA-binding regulatory protein
MSGHSKWSSIKHKKAARDAKRGKLFTKLIKEITIAARLGGGDLNANPRLRTAVTTAKTQSMPNDNIDRAIKKGTGELGGAQLEQVTYEGYGPGGVAIIIDVLSDNRNRVVAELRFILSRHGGNLGEAGCVAWMFKKRGVITIEKSAADEDKLLELALDAGADDVVTDDDGYQVMTPLENFGAVRDAIEKAKIPIVSAEVMMVPENTVKVTGHTATQVLKLMEELEDHAVFRRGMTQQCCGEGVEVGYARYGGRPGQCRYRVRDRRTAARSALHHGRYSSYGGDNSRAGSARRNI